MAQPYDCIYWLPTQLLLRNGTGNNMGASSPYYAIKQQLAQMARSALAQMSDDDIDPGHRSFDGQGESDARVLIEIARRYAASGERPAVLDAGAGGLAVMTNQMVLAGGKVTAADNNPRTVSQIWKHVTWLAGFLTSDDQLANNQLASVLRVVQMDVTRLMPPSATSDTTVSDINHWRLHTDVQNMLQSITHTYSGESQRENIPPTSAAVGMGAAASSSSSPFTPSPLPVLQERQQVIWAGHLVETMSPVQVMRFAESLAESLSADGVAFITAPTPLSFPLPQTDILIHTQPTVIDRFAANHNATQPGNARFFPGYMAVRSSVDIFCVDASGDDTRRVVRFVGPTITSTAEISDTMSTRNIADKPGTPEFYRPAAGYSVRLTDFKCSARSAGEVRAYLAKHKINKGAVRGRVLNMVTTRVVHYFTIESLALVFASAGLMVRKAFYTDKHNRPVMTDILQASIGEPIEIHMEVGRNNIVYPPRDTTFAKQMMLTMVANKNQEKAAAAPKIYDAAPDASSSSKKSNNTIYNTNSSIGELVISAAVAEAAVEASVVAWVAAVSSPMTLVPPVAASHGPSAKKRSAPSPSLMDDTRQQMNRSPHNTTNSQKRIRPNTTQQQHQQQQQQQQPSSSSAAILHPAATPAETTTGRLDAMLNKLTRTDDNDDVISMSGTMLRTIYTFPARASVSKKIVARRANADSDDEGQEDTNEIATNRSDGDASAVAITHGSKNNEDKDDDNDEVESGGGESRSRRGTGEAGDEDGQEEEKEEEAFVSDQDHARLILMDEFTKLHFLDEFQYRRFFFRDGVLIGLDANDLHDAGEQPTDIETAQEMTIGMPVTTALLNGLWHFTPQDQCIANVTNVEADCRMSASASDANERNKKTIHLLTQLHAPTMRKMAALLCNGIVMGLTSVDNLAMTIRLRWDNLQLRPYMDTVMFDTPTPQQLVDEDDIQMFR